MNRKLSVAILLTIAAIMPAANIYAADAGPGDARRNQSDQLESVNPPAAAEPVMPGTADKMPQAVGPGTLDAPPKPAAPGTLDKNVINPDVDIHNNGKPVPR